MAISTTRLPMHRRPEGGGNPFPASALTLLIVDDNRIFRRRLARAMEHRGFAVSQVDGVTGARLAISNTPPDYALVDIRLKDGCGLEIVSALHEKAPSAIVVVLTGYASIANAVSAVKAGASGYLSKTTDIEGIVEALKNPDAVERPEISKDPMPDDQVRWERLNRIYELCDRNISKTARKLDAHRRSLQRLLHRHAPY